MSNFRRALQVAARYRLMLAGILLSSLGVAAFWGANLGTVYPIVDVVLKGRSLRVWVDENIDDAIANVQSAEKEATALLGRIKNADAEQAAKLKTELSRIRVNQAADERALRLSQALKPWIHRYMPDRAFATLVIVVGALLVGSIPEIAVYHRELLVGRESSAAGRLPTSKTPIPSHAADGHGPHHGRTDSRALNAVHARYRMPDRGSTDGARPRDSRASENPGLRDWGGMDLLEIVVPLARRHAVGRLFGRSPGQVGQTSQPKSAG